METTIYLIRHAQSHPCADEHTSQWPLSSRGQEQAGALAPLLQALGIERLYSSPYRRCVDTVRPFAERSGLEVRLQHGLEEWKITPCWQSDLYDVWTKCWEDSGFALSGCESGATAQARFVRTVRTIVEECRGLTIGISTHGGVMGLLLNHLDGTCLRDCAEKIRNPDVLRIRANGEGMAWDRSFALAGLDGIASNHDETPIRTAG